MIWTLDPRSFTAWSVEFAGSAQRITEAGSIRITEAGAVISAGGNIRIIESKPFSWNQESNSFTTWVQE